MTGSMAEAALDWKLAGTLQLLLVALLLLWCALSAEAMRGEEADVWLSGA